MNRLANALLAAFLLFLAVGPLALLALLVRCSSRGPVLYWSQRVGRGNRLFWMPKLRTMRLDTPEVATHLLSQPEQWLTPVGGLLRRTSLDELPQLWSVLRGDMAFVGPRPALHNQADLIALRTRHGVHELVPGLTGWAQINGRDELSVADKVHHDTHYLHRRSWRFDLAILLTTIGKVLRREGIGVPACSSTTSCQTTDSSPSAAPCSLS